MLQPFAEEIWTVDGPIISVVGFPFPTRMIVIRLSDGGLFIWSPVALSEALRSAVDQLGPVRHIVAPNHLHDLFIAEWQRAYPEAELHAAPRLRRRHPELKWGDDLGDTPAPEWAKDLDQVMVRGVLVTTEVVFFHRRSRTVIFTDLIQQFEPGWFNGWRGLIAKLDKMTSPRPTVLVKYRIAFHDRSIARRAVQQILAWPSEGLLAAHAPPIKHGGRAAIAQAFSWLLPSG